MYMNTNMRFFEELIGRECEISLGEDEYEVATLVSIDGDWLKLDDGGRTILVNCNRIRSLSAEPENDREKHRKRWAR